MMKLLPWVVRCETLTLGMWLGSILFFSAVTAPTAFGALDRTQAGLFIRAVFPRYYMFGIVLGLITLALAVCVVLLAPGRLAYVPAVLVALMVGTTVYARQGLIPKVDTYREARSAAVEGSAEHANADAAFKAAHRLSVVLNGTVLLAGLVAFVGVVWPLSVSVRAAVSGGVGTP